MTLRSLYGYGSSLTRPVTMWLRNRGMREKLCGYVTSLTRPVTMWLRNREDKRALCRGRLAVDPPASGMEQFVEWSQLPTRTVGADRIRPNVMGTARLGERNNVQRYATQRMAQSRGVAGGFYPPLQSVFKIVAQRHCPAALPPGRMLSAPTAWAFTSSQFVPAGRAAAGHREVCPPGHPFQKSCPSRRHRRCRCPPPWLRRDR